MAIVLCRDGFWISPYVFSCFVALREKRVDFTVREIALQRGEQKGDAYVSSTVTGRVPSLTHDGFTVAESSAIVEYVDETFPGVHLLPTNAQSRARARQLMSWIRSDDTLVIREERPTHTMFYARATAPLSERAHAAAAKLSAITERVLGGGQSQNLFGDWCIADADLAFMLQRLVMNGDSLPARVRDYADAQWARPSVALFVAQPRPPYVPY
jgi:glutathione S-transferase